MLYKTIMITSINPGLAAVSFPVVQNFLVGSVEQTNRPIRTVTCSELETTVDLRRNNSENIQSKENKDEQVCANESKHNGCV